MCNVADDLSFWMGIRVGLRKREIGVDDALICFGLPQPDSFQGLVALRVRSAPVSEGGGGSRVARSGFVTCLL